MTVVGWLQIAIVLALVVAAAIPMSRLIDAFTRAGPTFFRSRSARWSAPSTASPESTRRVSKPGSPTRSRCRVLDRRLLSLYALSDSRTSCRSTRRVRRRAGRSRLQHLDQLHHQHQLAELRRRDDHKSSLQMLGLTMHNFLSAATGLRMAFALVRGFARPRPGPSAISGSI